MAHTVLVEMRAGLLELKGGRLIADTRRGMLQVGKVCYFAPLRWVPQAHITCMLPNHHAMMTLRCHHLMLLE